MRFEISFEHSCFHVTFIRLSSLFLSFFFFSQIDRFQSGIPADVYRSKAQPSPQRTSSSSPLSSFFTQPKQRPPSGQLLATQAEGDLLLAALRRYLSGHLGVSPEEEEEEDASARLRTFYGNGIENTGLKKESSNLRPLKTGRTQGAVKDPLTSVDGT